MFGKLGEKIRHADGVGKGKGVPGNKHIYMCMYIYKNDPPLQ
jgi:hypothetical protein